MDFYEEDVSQILRFVRYAVDLDLELGKRLSSYIKSNIGLLKSADISSLQRELLLLFKGDRERVNRAYKLINSFDVDKSREYLRGKKVLFVTSRGSFSEIVSEGSLKKNMVRRIEPAKFDVGAVKWKDWDVVLIEADKIKEPNRLKEIREKAPNIFRVSITEQSAIKEAYDREIIGHTSNLAVVKDGSGSFNYLITPEYGQWDLQENAAPIKTVLGLIELRHKRTRLKPVPNKEIVQIDDILLKEFQMAGGLLTEYNLAPVVREGTYGNLSMRRSQNSFVITAKGVNKGNLSNKDLAVIEDVDIDAETLKAKGSLLPSSETVMHSVIYESCPEAGAIVHGHLDKDELELWSRSLNLPVTEDPYACGTVELANETAKFVRDGYNLVLIRNHGFIAVGKSLKEAMDLSLYFRAKAHSVVEEKALDDFGEDFESKRGRYTDEALRNGVKGVYAAKRIRWRAKSFKGYALLYNGKIAGRAVYDTESNTIEELFILEDYRGMRLGDFFLEEMLKRYPNLNISTEKDFQLYPFLLSKGFVETGTIEDRGYKVVVLGQPSNKRNLFIKPSQVSPLRKFKDKILPLGKDITIFDALAVLKGEFLYLKNRKIIVAVDTDDVIEAANSLTLISALVQRGCDVRVIFTKKASEYIGEETIKALSRNLPITLTVTDNSSGLFPHIAAAKSADGIILVSNNAESIAKKKMGIADDLLSSVLNASSAPLFHIENLSVRHIHERLKEKLNSLKGKTVFLGVCGSIAAYKALHIADELKRAGLVVKVGMSKSAERFVSKGAFEEITGKPVAVGVFDKHHDKWPPAHINWREGTDIFLLAPATFNTIGEIASGTAREDSFIANVISAAPKGKPILIAPAMNNVMFGNPVLQENLSKLKARGMKIIGPGYGYLAEGGIARGRLSSVSEILEEVVDFVQGKPSFIEVLRDLLLPRSEELKNIKALHSSKRRNGVTLPLDIRDGKICTLIAHRKKDLRRYPDMWVLPGGGVNRGESEEAGALRELGEEANIRTDEHNILGILNEQVTGNNRHYIKTYVVQAPKEFELKISDEEYDDYAWVPIEEILSGDALVKYGIEGTVEVSLMQFREVLAEALIRMVYPNEVIPIDKAAFIKEKIYKSPSVWTDVLNYLIADKDLAGKKIVVTAGPTRELIPGTDVFITNRSSGKQGFAIAREAAKRGAEVILVSGPSSLPTPLGVRRVDVETAVQMQEEVNRHIKGVDVFIGAAAVADFRPAGIKQEAGAKRIILEQNPDIIKELEIEGIKIGFAAETNDLKKNALGKLESKNLAMIVGNDISAPGAGFRGDTNKVNIYRSGRRETLHFEGTKKDVAKVIIDEVKDIGIKERNWDVEYGEIDGVIRRRAEEFLEQGESAYAEGTPIKKPLLQDLAGRKFIITASNTEEDFDPVRFLSCEDTNSGLAVSISHILAERGAEVVLIGNLENRGFFGKVRELPPLKKGDRGGFNLTVVQASTAAQIKDALQQNYEEGCTIIDLAKRTPFAPAVMSDRKIKKESGPPSFIVEDTVDYLADFESAGVIKHEAFELFGGAMEALDVVLGNRRMSLPGNILNYAKLYGDKRAFKVWDNGKSQGVSWKELKEGIEKVGIGLMKAGIRKGAKVAILSEERVEFIFTHYGVLACGAVSVPIFWSNSSEQAAYILNDTEAEVVFVSNEEQLRKVLAVKYRLPALKYIIPFDNVDEGRYLLPFANFLHNAEDVPVSALKKRMDSIELTDTASINYTSGTTGEPKGVILSHQNMLAQTAGMENKLPLGTGDVFLSYLPLAHVGGRSNLYYALSQGADLIFPRGRDINSILLDFRENKPTIVFAVPSLIERLYAHIQNVISESGLKENHSADFEEIREIILELTGGRLKYIQEGGAPLDEKIVRFFDKFGLPVLEAYGLTETSSGITFNTPRTRKIGTVGKSARTVEVKIDPATGEVLVKGQTVMQEYLNKPDITADAFDGEGWFKTGDTGVIEPGGFLKITGRIKDIMVTSGGTLVPRVPIERAVSDSKYISQVHLIADGMKYAVALIVPDMKELLQYAEEQEQAGRVYFTREKDLLNNEIIQNLLWQEVEKINSSLDEFQKIKRIALLSSPFSETSGELGSLGKKNRRSIEQNRRDTIKNLYKVRDRSVTVIAETAPDLRRREKLEYARARTEFKAVPADFFRDVQGFDQERTAHLIHILQSEEAGKETFDRMEELYRTSPHIKVYAILFEGKAAGRVVFNEETHNLIEGIVLERFKGNYLGDMMLEFLKRTYKSFVAPVPVKVPMAEFLRKRGLRKLDRTKTVRGVEYGYFALGYDWRIDETTNISTEDTLSERTETAPPTNIREVLNNLQKRPCILIAEDEGPLVDKGLREKYRKWLDSWGYDSVIAEDGEEALRIFRANPDKFALLISDLDMPNMNGERLIENIRKIRPSIKIIVISRRNYGGDFEEGPDFYIWKARLLKDESVVLQLRQTIGRYVPIALIPSDKEPKETDIAVESAI